MLNTDNLNMTGESFDYGVALPALQRPALRRLFDETGLYAFGRRPEAVFWNLQLAGGLSLIEVEPLVGGAERLRLATATCTRWRGAMIAPAWG